MLQNNIADLFSVFPKEGGKKDIFLCLTCVRDCRAEYHGTDTLTLQVT